MPRKVATVDTVTGVRQPDRSRPPETMKGRLALLVVDELDLAGLHDTPKRLVTGPWHGYPAPYLLRKDHRTGQ